MRFSIPFPNSSWATNGTDHLVSDWGMGSVPDRFVLDTDGPLSNSSSESGNAKPASTWSSRAESQSLTLNISIIPTHRTLLAPFTSPRSPSANSLLKLRRTTLQATSTSPSLLWTTSRSKSHLHSSSLGTSTSRSRDLDDSCTNRPFKSSSSLSSRSFLVLRKFRPSCQVEFASNPGN